MDKILLNRLDEIPPHELIFGVLPVLSNKIQIVADKSMEKVTLKQWLLLIMVMQFQEKIPTLSEVANAMGSSRQNVKQIALKLEQKGFLRIEKDQKDSRILRVSVLPACLEMFERQAAYEKHFLELFYKGMSEDEMKLVARGLKKLALNITDMEELLEQGGKI